MALMFCDSFDHYSGTEGPIGRFTLKWDSDAEGVGEHAIIGNTEENLFWLRRPGAYEQALISESIFYTSILRKQFTEWYNGFVMGFAFFVYPGLSAPSSPLIAVYDRNSQCVAGLRCTNPSGNIEIAVGLNGAHDLAGYWSPDFAEYGNQTYYKHWEITESPYVNWGTWHHIEWKVVFDSTNGSYEVRLDEVEVMKKTGIDTIGSSHFLHETTGEQTLASIAIGKELHHWYMIDDFYLLDLTGSTSNDFLGDCRVDCLFTNAAGYYTQFNPVPNTNPNWVNAGENRIVLAYIDCDATYNEAFIATRDTYNMQSLVSLGTPIHGIQQNAALRKTDAGRKEVSNLLRVSSTDYENAKFRIQDHYKVYHQPYTLNPYTSAAWTEADIDALESGVRIIE